MHYGARLRIAKENYQCILCKKEIHKDSEYIYFTEQRGEAFSQKKFHKECFQISDECRDLHIEHKQKLPETRFD